MLDLFAQHWRDALEIGLLATAIYFLYRWLRLTRGARALALLLAALVSITLLAQILQLTVVSWLLQHFAAVLVIAFIVIFQPEMRRALAELGGNSLLGLGRPREGFLDSLVEAIEELSHRRHGALITLQRRIDLEEHFTSGVKLDAAFSKELIHTIFHPKTDLHDGAVIIVGDRIVAAACVLPVSQRELSDRSTGLRHRAGLGIAEETDAIAIVVSEETGQLSLCHDSELIRDLSSTEILESIERLLYRRTRDLDEDPSTDQNPA